MSDENGFESRILICIDCGEEFAFPAQAQEYFAERGYTEDPKRCKACHTKFKRMQRSGGSSENRPSPPSGLSTEADYPG
jgi:hypothetical protein